MLTPFPLTIDNNFNILNGCPCLALGAGWARGPSCELILQLLKILGPN